MSLGSIYGEPFAPVINPEAPVGPAEDALTLARALGMAENDGPGILRPVIGGAADVVQGHASALVFLSRKAPELTVTVAGSKKEPLEVRQRAAASDTGEIPIDPAALFADDAEPGEDDPAMNEEEEQQIVAEVAPQAVFLREKREAEEKKDNPHLNIVQAAIAAAALRELAREGDPAAQDMLARQPDILAPASRPAARALLPIALLTLISYRSLKRLK